MKRMLFVVIAVLLFTVIPETQAWSDCTPQACPEGFTDNGVVCSGSACSRRCSGFACDNASWDLPHDDYRAGLIWDERKNYDSATFNSYTPPSINQCYRFEYYPTRDNVFFKAEVDGYDVCDVEGMAALVDNTNRNDPWYKNIQNGGWFEPNYLNVTDPSSSYNHMLKLMRAHTDEDSIEDPHFALDYATANYVYCAPSAMACDLLSNFSPTINCASGCVGRDTSLFIMTGHFVEKGNPDVNLYTDNRCAGKYVGWNRLGYTGYRVYTTPANISITNYQICERPNEAPYATDVRILPLTPTAGHDIFCEYTFIDPEGFQEANSSYEWWKNNVYQSITTRMLNKSYLNSGDNWFCRVIPHDGIQAGLPVQSNTVIIQSTVKDLRMDVETIPVWERAGYFAGPEYVDNFTEPINQSLPSCTPDPDQKCTIVIDFRSNAVGKLDLEDLGMYHLIINQLPLVNIPDQDTNEDQGKTINVSQYATDPDNDQLQFMVIQENLAELNCEINAELLTMTPAANWNGIGNEAASCTIGVNDGMAVVNQTFFVNVTPVNDPPVLSFVTETLVEDAWSQSLELMTYARDIEDDRLTFTVLQENPAQVDCTIINTTLSMTPAPHWNGATSCLIKADDGNPNGTTQGPLPITVLPVNDPPTLVLPTKTIDEDSELSTLDLTFYADDVDGDPLLFMLTEENRSAVDCAVYGNIFSYQPIVNWYGTSSCAISVDDNHGGIAHDTMMVTVLSVNDAPFLSMIPPLTVSEGNILFQPLYAFDVEKDLLYYNINDSRFSLNGSMLKYATQEGDADNFTLRVSVDDGMNTTIQNVPVIVQPYNGTIDGFVGGSSERIMSYVLPGSQYTYVRIKKDAMVINASLMMKGFNETEG
ncbi:tandem-95 repeat protein [Candidatus Woesearchaeota archaeon]|nr:tandem-95 repeat protein [Candidatus Woesearchaeota archaeon]